MSRPPELAKVPTPASVFRFSAVTWNAHRVHYDEPYATSVEGHQGLLVQAHLLASYLCEMLVAWAGPGGRITRLNYQVKAPVYVGTPIRCWGRPVPGRPADGCEAVDLEIGIDIEDRTVVQGTAQLRRSAG